MTSEIILHYEKVGRERFTDDIKTVVNKGGYEFSPDDIAAIAFKEARLHLMSANVDVRYNPKTNMGTIYAGFHTVGKFWVVK